MTRYLSKGMIGIECSGGGMRAMPMQCWVRINCTGLQACDVVGQAADAVAGDTACFCICDSIGDNTGMVCRELIMAEQARYRVGKLCRHGWCG